MFIGLHFDENGGIHNVYIDCKMKNVRNTLLNNVKVFKLDNNIQYNIQLIGIEHWKHPKMTISLFDKNNVKHYWTINEL